MTAVIDNDTRDTELFSSIRSKANMRKYWTPESRRAMGKRVKDARRAGWTWVEIADAAKCSTSTAREYLKSYERWRATNEEQ